MDELGYQQWQLSADETVTFENLSARIHPADRDRVRAAFLATRSVASFYETDFRIILEDEVKWISSREQGADFGMVSGHRTQASRRGARALVRRDEPSSQESTGDCLRGLTQLTVRSARYNSSNYPIVDKELVDIAFATAAADRAYAKEHFGAKPGEFAAK